MEAFLDYWEEKKDAKSITGSEDSEAVKMMTIHKSKGLEFPVVIIANCNGVLADLQHTQDWINLDESKFGIPFFYSSISKSIAHLNDQTEKSYLKNISKEELSSMNTAYVAMTRPVDHLYMLSQPITHKKDYNFEDLLKDFLMKSTGYDEDKTTYSFGQKRIKKTTPQKQNQNNSVFHSYDIQRFYKTLTANETLVKSESAKQIYGKEVHDVLQKIIYKEDLYDLEIEENLPKVEEVIQHPDLSRFFEDDWTVYNEMDLVNDHNILRPDRVCIKNSEAVIIDYKTGVEKESHLQQLTRYKVALEAMGYSIKSAFLVYIRKNIYIVKL
jgi:ATP-dependent exoDNAse (exonuclease V) beta subunit